MRLFKEGFTNDLNQADYKLLDATSRKNTSLKKTQSFRGMRLGPRGAYMQISSKNKKKNHVNPLQKHSKTYYVNWKNTPKVIAESNNGNG